MSINAPTFSCSSGFDKEQHAAEPLTNPSEPVGNDGLDNVNGDLICYKNYIIFDNEGRRFQVKKWLGSGQFGQVYECVFLNPPSNWRKSQNFAIKISKSTNDAHCMFQYESKALQYVSFIFLNLTHSLKKRFHTLINQRCQFLNLVSFTVIIIASLSNYLVIQYLMN